jgi:hypothetical protein
MAKTPSLFIAAPMAKPRAWWQSPDFTVMFSRPCAYLALRAWKESSKIHDAVQPAVQSVQDGCLANGQQGPVLIGLRTGAGIVPQGQLDIRQQAFSWLRLLFRQTFFNFSSELIDFRNNEGACQENSPHQKHCGQDQQVAHAGNSK